MEELRCLPNDIIIRMSKDIVEDKPAPRWMQKRIKSRDFLLGKTVRQLTNQGLLPVPTRPVYDSSFTLGSYIQGLLEDCRHFDRSMAWQFDRENLAQYFYPDCVRVIRDRPLELTGAEEAHFAQFSGFGIKEKTTSAASAEP
jgi:hypothetical protein